MAMDNSQTTGPSTLDLAQDNGYFMVRAMVERLERIQDAILSGRAKPSKALLGEVAELIVQLEDHQ